MLRTEMPHSGHVLEIASGTGEHAVYFTPRLHGLIWQPTDPDLVRCESIDAWRESEPCDRLLPAVQLDVCVEPWPLPSETKWSAIVCINMIHIAPWQACESLVAGAAKRLPTGAPLILYGPFFRRDIATAPSNLEFDESLRARDPSWGIRHLDQVEQEAQRNGFELSRVVEMPANNLTVLFRKH
ncbi:MAG: DUF938 domain-containing protein [Polyangiaceae bacterium]